MNELEFKKFIAYEVCTNEEFKKAKKYYGNTNDYTEKKEFIFTCFRIINEIIEETIRTKKYSLLEFQDIYLAHGLSYIDFNIYYHLYNSKIIDINTRKKLYFLIFEAAKKCLWQEDKLSLIANNFMITTSELKLIINDYFENELQIKDIKEYKRLYKNYFKFINNNLASSQNLALAYSFYLKYASNKEKEEFQKKALNIIKTSLKRLDNMEEYAKTLNLRSLDIYFLTENFTPNLVNNIASSFKIYYDFYVQCMWNIEEVKKEALRLNIKYKDFLDMARIYCSKILHKDIRDLRQSHLYQGKNNDLTKMGILAKIYQSTDSKEYFSLIENSEITYGDIYYFCYIFNKNLPDIKKFEMESNIKAKFNKYRTPKNIPKVNKEILLDALDSFYTLEEYCIAFGYNYMSFKDYFYDSKDEDILRRYKEKLQKEKEERETYRNNLTFKILEYIKYGFKSDTVYPFTLIDFFILFPNINYKYIRIGCLPYEDGFRLRKFFEPLKKARTLSKEAILNKKFDNITQEDLIKIIGFMEYYNIPLNDVLVLEMIKKYKNNSLNLYEFDNFMLK